MGAASGLRKFLAVAEEVVSACLESSPSSSEEAEVEESISFPVNEYLWKIILPGQMLTRINLTFS